MYNCMITIESKGQKKRKERKGKTKGEIDAITVNRDNNDLNKTQML